MGELLAYPRPGDTVHISEVCRFVRGTGHILDVLDILHRDRLALRIHDGAFSAMDLTARHPRTGELLSTVKFMVQALAAACELQRDLQRELTYDGLRAAEAKGNKGGRRPAIPATKTESDRAAYLRMGALEDRVRISDRGLVSPRGAGLGPLQTGSSEARMPYRDCGFTSDQQKQGGFVTGTLVVHAEQPGLGRAGTFAVVVDEATVGQVKQGSSARCPAAVGTHTVRVTGKDGTRSNTATVEVFEGQDCLVTAQGTGL
ncbi:recombinase family protein [Streptomyces sp. G-G2]|uniref:recombinase family protein n=1 Tax=Streptomyces sp. G-G2 TaxID=3046201 RepID=UPI0024BB24AD|nr:recombinase family protein [Streptomyces sp. G-G2]MDJ0384547.1 recombinase family protein [Streptomyces sp. G-G2]